MQHMHTPGVDGIILMTGHIVLSSNCTSEVNDDARASEASLVCATESL